jgi:hypothetical protein
MDIFKSNLIRKDKKWEFILIYVNFDDKYKQKERKLNSRKNRKISYITLWIKLRH